MDDEQFPDYLRQAIADGEVTIDEEAKTARIHIDVGTPDAGANAENIAGPILAKLKKKLGLKARLEYLGYTVES